MCQKCVKQYQEEKKEINDLLETIKENQTRAAKECRKMLKRFIEDIDEYLEEMGVKPEPKTPNTNVN